MRILDRYLLRQFLQNFFVCFFSLTGLYIVMDAFAKLESFMRARGNLLVNMGSIMRITSTAFSTKPAAF